MVLMAMTSALIAVCIMGYLYMKSIETIVKTINLYPEVQPQQEDESHELGELTVLPQVKRNAATLSNDFELWYQEQEALRATDPQSPLIDPEWESHSAERQALHGGVEW